MALLPNITGFIDGVTNTVLPNDTNSWANLTANNASTWGELTSWVTRPADPLIWLSDPIDLGKEVYFTLQITTEAVGNVNYTVYTSNVGSFANAYTTANTITSGSSGIAAFYGRYVTVAAEVYNTGGLHSLQTMELTAGTQRFDILMSDIDSSGLTGTISSRQLPIERTVSKVLNIQMTPYLTTGGSGYTQSGYVASTYFDETLVTGAFPQIIDKNGTGANVAFVDNDGNYIDCVFDAVAWVYPEQYMDGNNLKVR